MAQCLYWKNFTFSRILRPDTANPKVCLWTPILSHIYPFPISTNIPNVLAKTHLNISLFHKKSVQIYLHQNYMSSPFNLYFTNVTILGDLKIPQRPHVPGMYLFYILKIKSSETDKLHT